MRASQNFVLAFAVFVAIGATSAAAASSASVDRQFRNAVARVLDGVESEFLDELSAAEKRDFVACAQRIMDSAPLARKQYVLAAGSASEMRQRFDEVALDNRAELKQRVASECA